MTPVSSQQFYIGTYTQPILFGTGEVMHGRGKGIYLVGIEPDRGSLTLNATFPHIVNPSFLALSPNGRYLYSVNELKDETEMDGGFASAFAIGPGHAITQLNTKPTGGADPCHITLSNSGGHAVVSNFMSGSVCVYPVLQDGSLGEMSCLIQHSGSGLDPVRQQSAHAHSAVFDPQGRFLLVPDLGIDQVVVYRLDERSGTLCRIHTYQASPGAGPRFCEFHPFLPICYLINELSSSISALSYTPDTGVLTHCQTLSTLEEGDDGRDNICADLHITPDGRFLYGSNRGRNTIAMFRLDEQGEMYSMGRASSGGRTPRNFSIDPGGQFLIVANQDSDNLVTFFIDPNSGSLERRSELMIPSPVCIRPIIGK